MSDLSQPANTRSQDVGIGLFISTKQKSALVLLAFNEAPLIVRFVGPLALLLFEAQTGFGLIQPNLKAHPLGLL